MTSLYRAGQFVPPKGGLMQSRPNVNIFGIFAGTPTASISGYEVGAIAIDTTNGAWYLNSGTATSATWVRQTGTVSAETITTLTAGTLITNAVNGAGSTIAFTDRITGTDGVASGTARILGGSAFVDVSTSDTVTAAASNNAFVSFAQTYPIPANTLKAGTVLRARLFVDVVNAAAGTATLTVNLRLGGTSVIATTAVDPAANDWQSIEFTFVSRAAPSATSAVVGVGRWNTSVAGTNVTKEAILQSTNFATNGALTLDCQAKWSTADATTTAQLELFNVEVIG